MMEAKPVGTYADAPYRIGSGNLIAERNRVSSHDTTHMNFPYNQRMNNLKADGVVNSIPFKQLHSIQLSDWWGLDR